MSETARKSLLSLVVHANPALMTFRIDGEYCDWETSNEYRVLAVAADGTETDLVFYKLTKTYRLWRDGVEVGWN